MPDPIDALRALPRFAYLSREDAREAVIAVLRSLRAPPASAIRCLYLEDYPRDWERGKLMQRELGSEVVPFQSEHECVAGQYQRFIDALVAEIEGEGR